MVILHTLFPNTNFVVRFRDWSCYLAYFRRWPTSDAYKKEQGLFLYIQTLILFGHSFWLAQSPIWHSGSWTSKRLQVEYGSYIGLILLSRYSKLGSDHLDTNSKNSYCMIPPTVVSYLCWFYALNQLFFADNLTVL